MSEIIFCFLWFSLKLTACCCMHSFTVTCLRLNPKCIKRGVCKVICLKTIAYSFKGYPDLIFMIRCCS